MFEKQVSDTNESFDFIKRDIYISEAGFIESKTIERLSSPNPDDLLLLSPTAQSLRIYLNDKHIILAPNELIITTKDQVSLLGQTQALYLYIHGTLAQKYIGFEKRNIVLTFSAADDIIAATRFFTDAITKGLTIPVNKRIKAAFTIALDIFMYTEQQSIYPVLVQDALEIINTEYCFISGIDELADKLGVTKSHLIRVFRSALGVTPGVYLERIRMDKAKLYLRSRSLNMESIAHLTGYSCANYFAKVFKRNTGVSPTDYVHSSPDDHVDITHEIPDDFFV